MKRSIDVHVPALTRVEGEGALHVVVDDGAISDLRLEIYEPPRYFEALLRGRTWEEPIDITARICGICPVAYQMSATTALERLAGVEVGGPLRDLRRLLYAGEWIESHCLHIGLLHAPDFLGAASGLELAARHPEAVERILQLKKVGNDLIDVVGGRPIHPVNLRLGGFHRLPTREEIGGLAEPLAWAHDAAVELVRWTAALDAPSMTIGHELVSLRHDTEYPMLDGRIVSDRGLDIDVSDFETEFVEEQVAHSTALHGRRRDGAPYLTGPLARWSNNPDTVPSEVRALATLLGVGHVERNPFRSIVVRSLEVLIAVIEARAIVDSYVEPDKPSVDVPTRAGTGWGASEAPRGLLYHRYSTDSDGMILDASIVPPTAQNQPAIELDVRSVVEHHLAAEAAADDAGDPAGTDDELRHRCEMTIRNYDPCISCAAHFLTVDVEYTDTERAER